jgi:ATP-dependent Lhr-like helicase
VGTVDLVAQINSPRAIAVTLQRVGRSGHWRGAIPKGRLFATTRDDCWSARRWCARFGKVTWIG